MTSLYEPPGSDDVARDPQPSSEPADAALLAVTELGCTLAARTLWQDVAFVLKAGSSLAVTGASGSGKTLLLRTLAGLRPTDHGAIRCKGKPLDDWWMPEYRAHIVYLAQRAALPDGSVRAALAAPFALHVHHRQQFDAAFALRCLDALGLPPAFLDQAADDLSGGELQIAALIRALLVEPSVLLLDEPTAALDPERTRRVEALLDTWLRGAPQRACIWVSHDAAQVNRVSQRTLALGAP